MELLELSSAGGGGAVKVLWGFERTVRKLILSGKMREAAGCLRERLREDSRPRSRYLNYLGVCESHMGHLDAARDLFIQALIASPRDPKPLNNLGNIAFIKNDTEAARQYYMRSLKENVWATEPRYNLTVLYQDLGHSEKALSSHEGYMTTKRAIRWAKIAALALTVLFLIILASL